MAIDSRNFSIEGVSNILTEGENALSSLNGNDKINNLTFTIKRLKQKIEFLEGLEDRVLSLFPSPNDRDSIREKIIEYNNTNFSGFFGLNLKQAFINEFSRSAKAMKNKELREQNLLAEYIVQQLYNSLNSDIPTDEIGAEIAKHFNFTLSAIVTKNGTRVSTRGDESLISLKDDGPHIVIEKITPAMRERLKQILGRLEGKKSKYRFPNLKYAKLSDFTKSKSTLTIQVESEWLSNTQGITEKDIKEKLDSDPATWKPFVDKANINIINMLSKEVSDDVKMYFTNYLKGMVEKDPTIFFLGKSTNDVIGLLGEITTVLAIQKLTGKKVSVEWVAHNKNDGKKVSIDVVLKSQLGINVKNTSQNFGTDKGFLRIDFVDRNPEDILNTLLGKNNLNTALSDAFQTSFFNTSYQIVPTRPHVIKGSNSSFDELESGLLNFREHLTTYLYQFAPEMLFMATDDLEKQLLVLDEQLNRNIQGSGNILYMVSGLPFFPSEMLKDLKNDLDKLTQDLLNKTNFRDKSFFFDIGSSNSTTIIDVLNKRAASGQSVALKDGGGADLTIQMTSSWLF